MLNPAAPFNEIVHSPSTAISSPAPIVATSSTDQWPVIDDAAFHGLAGEVVRTIEPHSEADPVALLLQLNDENRSGERAALECVQRWTAAGREVIELIPKHLG